MPAYFFTRRLYSSWHHMCTLFFYTLLLKASIAWVCIDMAMKACARCPHFLMFGHLFFQTIFFPFCLLSSLAVVIWSFRLQFSGIFCCAFLLLPLFLWFEFVNLGRWDMDVSNFPFFSSFGCTFSIIAYIEFVAICSNYFESYVCRCSLTDAQKVFDEMPQRNLTICYNALISGYVQNCHFLNRFLLFSEIRLRRVSFSAVAILEF